jgi:hypothetical protein
VRKVERSAAETLERCRLKCGLDEIPLPVPVELWIENPLKYRFSVADLSHLGENVLGGAFLEKGEIVISAHLEHQIERYRFTAAHELGHLRMHRRLAPFFKDTSDAPPMSATNLNKIEWEADRFAAAFLMPPGRIVPEIYAACRRFRLDENKCVPELLMSGPASEWLWRYRILPCLTRSFEVSLSAMLNRFTDLVFLDEKPFMLPQQVRRLARPAEETDEVRHFRLRDGFPESQPVLFAAG